MKENVKTILQNSQFEAMTRDFETQRINDYFQWLNAQKKRGKILPFIRGLRLSAHLIYAIREVLEGSNLTANWGHIISPDSTLFSAECDIIIHKKGYHIKWNGDNNFNKIMDFRFIDTTDVIAVISCKSYITCASIDKEYPTLLKEYTDNVWLFAECCSPTSAEKIKNASIDFGYTQFWYFYTWKKKTNHIGVKNSEGWEEFIKEIIKLKS